MMAFVFFPILLFAFAYGSLAEVNEIFDSSHAQTFRTAISNMREDTGRPHTYTLMLGAWDGRPAGDEAKVSSSYYRTARIGQPICVYLFDGALGFRHYDVGGCN